jgi:hypothetical protein
MPCSERAELFFAILIQEELMKKEGCRENQKLTIQNLQKGFSPALSTSSTLSATLSVPAR